MIHVKTLNFSTPYSFNPWSSTASLISTCKLAWQNLAMMRDEMSALPMHVQVRQWCGEGVSVMVWGGISGAHWNDLVDYEGNLTGVRYRGQILERHVALFMWDHPEVDQFQHDNALLTLPECALVFLREQEPMWWTGRLNHQIWILLKMYGSHQEATEYSNNIHGVDNTITKRAAIHTTEGCLESVQTWSEGGAQTVFML